jgi:hypothetical protein
VKGGHGTEPSFEAAKDDLIYDAQLIERSFASVFVGQFPKQISREFDTGLSRYIVWFINHILLSVPRISL